MSKNYNALLKRVVAQIKAQMQLDKKMSAALSPTESKRLAAAVDDPYACGLGELHCFRGFVLNTITSNRASCSRRYRGSSFVLDFDLPDGMREHLRLGTRLDLEGRVTSLDPVPIRRTLLHSRYKTGIEIALVEVEWLKYAEFA